MRWERDNEGRRSRCRAQAFRRDDFIIMFHDFKYEIKLFLIVAVVSVLIIAGGILALRTMNPSATGYISESEQTQEPAIDTNGWQTYRNDEYGFEFQYPKVFDQKEQCRLREGIKSTGVEEYRILGNRINIIVRDSQGQTLDELVERELQRLGDSVEELHQGRIVIAGEKAAILSYRSKGMGRYGEANYLLRDGKIYEFSFFAGPRCLPSDMLDESELSVLSQILSTFRFIDNEGKTCETYKACELGTGEIREFNSCDPPPSPIWAPLINGVCPGY